MKIEFKGPLVVFKNVSKDPNYEVVIHTRRIVEEDGCLAINTSQPDDVEHWVEVKVLRKVDNEQRVIDIRCANYDEAMMASETIVKHREKTMQNAGEKKPWHKPPADTVDPVEKIEPTPETAIPVEV